MRQSLASSTAARVSWPGYCSSLASEPLEQREGVGGGAGEAADHVALAEPAHLLGVGLDDGLADRDLAVAADRDHAALADGQDGGAVPELGLGVLHDAMARAGRDVGESRAPSQTRRSAVANPANR